MGLEGFNTTLTWSGFVKRKSPPAGVDADAETVSWYKTGTIQFGAKGKAVVVKSVDVKISLKGKESWVVEGKLKTELLKHEQGHYDITALAAREYYNKFFTLAATDAQDLQEKIDKLGQAIGTKLDNAHIRYDEQTAHSQAKALQEKWNKALATEKKKQDGSLDNLP